MRGDGCTSNEESDGIEPDAAHATIVFENETTTVNVAAGLAQRGRRVFVVDLDRHGSASLSLGVGRDHLAPSSAEVLSGDVPVREAIRPTGRDRVDLLTGCLCLCTPAPSAPELADGEAGDPRVRSLHREGHVSAPCPQNTNPARHSVGGAALLSGRTGETRKRYYVFGLRRSKTGSYRVGSFSHATHRLA